MFVSPAGICGSPMKLQQPCDIAERYVTCTQQGRRWEKRRIKVVYSSTQEQIQAAITEATGTLRYSALRPRQTKVVEHSQLCFSGTRNLLFELLFLFVNRLSPRLSQPSQLFHRPNTRFTQVGLLIHENRVSTPPGNSSVPTRLSTLHTGALLDYVVGFFH